MSGFGTRPPAVVLAELDGRVETLRKDVEERDAWLAHHANVSDDHWRDIVDGAQAARDAIVGNLAETEKFRTDYRALLANHERCIHIPKRFKDAEKARSVPEGEGGPA